MDPPSNSQHHNTALGVVHRRLLALGDSIPAVAQQLTYVVGGKPCVL